MLIQGKMQVLLAVVNGEQYRSIGRPTLVDSKGLVINYGEGGRGWLQNGKIAGL